MKKKLFFITFVLLLPFSNVCYSNTDNNFLESKNYININTANDILRRLDRYEKSISRNINSLNWSKIPNDIALLYFWNVENYNSDSLYPLINKWIKISEEANNNYSNLCLVYLSLIKLDYDNALKYIEKVNSNDTEFLKDLGYTLIGKLEARKSFHNNPQGSYTYYKSRLVQKDDVEKLKVKYNDNPIPYYLSVLLLQNELSKIDIENDTDKYYNYYNQIVKDINSAINIDSNNLLFLLKKYELEYNSNNNIIFQKLYDLSLQDVFVAEIIGNIHARNNQIDLSIEFFKKALEKNTNNVGLYKKLASLYEYKQDSDSVIDIYKKAIKNNPDNFEFYVQLSEEYKKKQYYNEIIKLYEDYIRINPNNDEAYNLLGEAYENENMTDKSINSYLSAININNKNIKAYNNLLVKFFDIKDYENLIKYSTEAIKNNSEYLFGYIWISNGYLYKGETEKAIETLNTVIKLNPDFSQAYLSLGIIYNSNKEYDKAIINFEKALSKRDDVNTRLYLAETYSYKGDYSKAEDIYKDLVSKNPYDENIFFSIGNFYSDIKKYDEAEKSFERAILLNTNFLDARNNLGNVYIKTGKIDKALLEFEKIIKLNPNYSTAYYNIACVYSLKKDKYRALEFLEQSIKMDKSLKEVARNDSDFDNIRNEIRFKKLIDN
jgi:tetratricopeptide (TPR) repeat protein